MVPEYLDVPIFPLPNVTLFPKALLPLHIFEPRYRKMISNCLNGDRLLAIGLLREGWQKDYFGRPPIFRTLGIGKIIDDERLEDGRYNILLEGLYRVRLVEEFPSDPFRVGRMSVLQDRPIDHVRGEVQGLIKEISDLCRLLGQHLPQYRDIIQTALASHPHPAITADLLASCLVVDPYDRQSILEERDPLRRIKLVRIQALRILSQLSPKEVEEEVYEED